MNWSTVSLVDLLLLVLVVKYAKIDQQELLQMRENVLTCTPLFKLLICCEVRLHKTQTILFKNNIEINLVSTPKDLNYKNSLNCNINVKNYVKIKL